MTYKKFKEGKECAYPERTECNYNREKGTERCEYMKCIHDYTAYWKCTYEKKKL